MWSHAWHIYWIKNKVCMNPITNIEYRRLKCDAIKQYLTIFRKDEDCSKTTNDTVEVIGHDVACS